MAEESEFKQFEHKLADGTAYTLGDGGTHWRVTEESLAEARRNQESWAKKTASPYLNLSPQMAAAARSARDLPVLLERWKRVSGTQTKIVAEQIAENYALQGLFAEAYVWAVLSGKRAPAVKYEQLWQALEKDDGHDCGCEQAFQADQANLTREHVLAWVPRDEQLFPVVRCSVCGDLNIKPLPAELSRQMAARAKARELTKNVDPVAAGSVLQDAGLTAEQVFGIDGSPTNR